MKMTLWISCFLRVLEVYVLLIKIANFLGISMSIQAEQRHCRLKRKTVVGIVIKRNTLEKQVK